MTLNNKKICLITWCLMFQAAKSATSIKKEDSLAEVSSLLKFVSFIVSHLITVFEKNILIFKTNSEIVKAFSFKCSKKIIGNAIHFSTKSKNCYILNFVAKI